MLYALAGSVLVAGVVADRPTLRFVEVAAQSGIVDTALVESCCWGDYDGDGDDDLYMTIQGPNRLLRNNGDGSFTDVTQQAGVGHPGWGVGCAFADLDNDGDEDLYVVNFGGGLDVLYRNDGDGTFTDVTLSAGVTDESSSRGMTLIDFDRDGLLDIYVNAIGRDILYHNLGSLRFENVAAQMGMTNFGQGVGAVATDIDGDGWLDLFTGNRSGDPNILYRNDRGTLVDITDSAGITEVGLGMGVLSLDFDGDLDMDLYWTTWPDEMNALYRNNGDLTFTDWATSTYTTDPDGWGISCNAGDVDRDGFMDFFVTNGFDPSSTKNVLFRNERGLGFSDASLFVGDLRYDGRGVAFSDYDLDGDMDIVVTTDEGLATRLYRNDTGTRNHWLSIRLHGTCSNASGIGARIEVTTDLATMVQEVSGGAGRGSFNSRRLLFGLNEASEIRRVRIFWPSGVVQDLADDLLVMDAALEVVESERADVNGDGARDADDFFAYLDLFAGGDARADMTGSSNPADPGYGLPDGVIDADDFFYFLDAFRLGGCPRGG